VVLKKNSLEISLSDYSNDEAFEEEI